MLEGGEGEGEEVEEAGTKGKGAAERWGCGWAKVRAGTGGERWKGDWDDEDCVEGVE